MLLSVEASISLTLADAYSVLGVLSSCGVFDTPDKKAMSQPLFPVMNGVNFDALKTIFGENGQYTKKSCGSDSNRHILLLAGGSFTD